MGVFRSVVVFGAPGTGKTSLLKALRAYNDELSCPYFFVTIDEPTQDPVIAALLADVYKETTTAINAGESKALVVQRLIADARADNCSSFMSSQILLAQREAAKRHKCLVVVSDGHLRTDEKIYVRRRGDLQQINSAEMLEFSAYRKSLLDAMNTALARPGLFCQMIIGNDTSGVKHQHRVCTLRNNGTEAGVSAAEFAEFARYADTAYDELQSEEQCVDETRQVCRIDTDGKSTVDVVTEFIALLAMPCPSPTPLTLSE